MADKFFDKEEVQEEVQEPAKFKIGEDEYTQEQLEHLVGLGKIGEEAEEKFKTKIDKVWPDYTRKSQELVEANKKLQEYETKLKSQPQTQPTQLTPELRAQAIAQLDDLLRESKVLEERTRMTTREELAANALISDVNTVISSAEADGKPTTTVDRILQHMQETGIKNPEKAYKDLFEDELDKWKESRLSTLKPSGMATTDKSVAGAKYPTQPRPPKNREELLKAVGDILNSPEA